MKKLVLLGFLFYFSLGVSGQNLSASHAWVSDNGTLAVDVFVDTEKDEVVLTLTGPDQSWFAYGFGGSNMAGTYAIIMEKLNGETVVTERHLGNHNEGTALEGRFSLISETVNDNSRTIVLSLPMTGSEPYFNFPSSPQAVSIISATGFGGSLGFHTDYLQGPQGGINDLEFSQVVPVTWSSFKLTREGYYAEIHWETASEINNEGFYIQRSPDGQTWIDLGFVKSRGPQGSVYQFSDLQTIPGVNYYRLKQVDLDGTITFSVIKSIEIQGTGTPDAVVIYPNPASDFLSLNNSTSKGPKRIQIYDMSYRLILDDYWPEGQVDFHMEIGNWQSGHYLVSVKHKDWTYINYFIKL
ncbi:T9SS type A sorting domain-containing protein [Portibacter marinus]|uniref:T9SS type A sorting domain-containing protein n=1 Tax=Portibacter marinus TaxID=2898660 RepID=UPI001F17B5D2|nr:T9SS type A sorting domain-containing protein [Portibacter marinus]